MRSSSTWALLPLLLSTFTQALPMPGQVPFGMHDEPIESTFPSLQLRNFARLGRLTTEHRCSYQPTLLHPSSSPRTTTYVQPYPLESTAAGVALLSSTSSATELVPLRSRFLPDVPQDVLVMRLVRDRFEEEAEGVRLLVDQSRTEASVSSADSEDAVVQLVGTGLAGPIALLHALHLQHAWSALLPRPSLSVTLFSSPRFANEPFSDCVASLVSSDFTLDAITSPLDALPLLPPRGAKLHGFRNLHAGTKWEMKEDEDEIVRWDVGLVAMIRREEQRWEAMVTGAQGWEAQFAMECPASVLA